MPLGTSGAVYSACPPTETAAAWTVLFPFSSPGNRAPDSGPQVHPSEPCLSSQPLRGGGPGSGALQQSLTGSSEASLSSGLYKTKITITKSHTTPTGTHL